MSEEIEKALMLVPYGFQTYNWNGKPISREEFIEHYRRYLETQTRTSCCDALIDEGKCCKCRRAIEDPPIP